MLDRSGGKSTGITFAPGDAGADGIVITGVAADSAAEAVGFKIGQKVTMINGIDVRGIGGPQKYGPLIMKSISLKMQVDQKLVPVVAAPVAYVVDESKVVVLDRTGGTSMGLTIGNASANDRGVLINNVSDGGQADLLGIVTGMEVMSINGEDSRGWTQQKMGAVIMQSMILNIELNRVAVPKEPEQVDGFGSDYESEDEDAAPFVAPPSKSHPSHNAPTREIIPADQEVPEVVSVVLDRGGGKSLGMAIFSAVSFDAGLEVVDIVRGGQAEEKGLQVGDQIVNIAGTSTLGMSDEDAGAIIVSVTQVEMHVIQAQSVRVPNLPSENDEVQIRLMKEVAQLQQQQNATNQAALAVREREDQRIHAEKQAQVAREKVIFERLEQEEKVRQQAKEKRFQQTQVQTKAVMPADARAPSFWKQQPSNAEYSAPRLQPTDAERAAQTQEHLAAQIATVRISDEQRKIQREQQEVQALAESEQRLKEKEERQELARMKISLATQKRVLEQSMQAEMNRGRGIQNAAAMKRRNDAEAALKTEELHEKAAATRAFHLQKSLLAQAEQDKIREDRRLARGKQLELERQRLQQADAEEEARKAALEQEHRAGIEARLQFESTQIQNNQWKAKSSVKDSGIKKAGDVAAAMSNLQTERLEAMKAQADDVARARETRIREETQRTEQLAQQKRTQAEQFRLQRETEQQELERKREADAQAKKAYNDRLAREFDADVQLRLAKEGEVLRHQQQQNMLSAKVRKLFFCFPPHQFAKERVWAAFSWGRAFGVLEMFTTWWPLLCICRVCAQLPHTLWRMLKPAVAFAVATQQEKWLKQKQEMAAAQQAQLDLEQARFEEAEREEEVRRAQELERQLAERERSVALLEHILACVARVLLFRHSQLLPVCLTLFSFATCGAVCSNNRTKAIKTGSAGVHQFWAQKTDTKKRKPAGKDDKIGAATAQGGMLF